MTNFAVTVYVWLCIILVLISAPMAFKKIEPNSSYGFRTSKTLSSEENWYKANQFSGWTTITASCVTLFCLLFLKFISKTSSRINNGLVYLMVYLVPLVISFFVSFLYLLLLLHIIFCYFLHTIVNKFQTHYEREKLCRM